MKRRHQFYLDGKLAEQLMALAAKPGSSKTAIMTDALQAYLDRRGAGELEERFKVRLDRLSMQLGRIERDLQVVAESLALLIRFQLTITGPLPEADRAARAIGQDRFHSFMQQVSRRIASGRSLSDDVLSPETAEAQR
ncbi:MAG TPA: ribbon-helix-helix protein, CopG family [Stellaceae bacterium]|nr:ribbon-helix-helix protein, CopG family [Stellaceae bacterium]